MAVPGGEFTRSPLNRTLVIENSGIAHHIPLLHQHSFFIKHRERFLVSNIKSRQIVLCKADGFLQAAEKVLEQLREHRAANARQLLENPNNRQEGQDRLQAIRRLSGRVRSHGHA